MRDLGSEYLRSCFMLKWLFRGASTGKSLPEALLFAELGVEHAVYRNCSECQKTISVHNMFSPCSELGIFMYWTCNSMNNLLSYYGLVDTKIRPSDKDLQPVTIVSNTWDT